MLPKCISLLSSASASLERLAEFLFADELQRPLVTAGRMPELALSGFTHELLRGAATLQARPGLSLLVGPTGGGKTSLLRFLIGELPPARAADGGNTALIRQCRGSTDPFIPLNQRIALCPESPWLVRGTIRANIVMGRASEDFDAERYHAAIEACALAADLREQPLGDLTEVGGGGSTLSGGQRARIALARAVYSGAEIIVLDEPLAGLDVVTAKHCFEHAIGELRARGVVVMACAAPAQQWVDEADTAHLCKDGTVVELRVGDSALQSFVATKASADEPEATAPEPEEVRGAPAPSSAETKDHAERVASQTAGRHSAVTDYAKACGAGMAPLALFLAVAAHAIFVGKDIVLSLWSEDEDPESGYRLLYAFLCLLVAGAHWVRFRLFFRMTLSASRVLHASLFAGVAGAPLSFFERTPVGDITARFAGDTDAVDTQLPAMLSGLLDGILSMLSGLAVVAGAAPLFMAVIGPIAYAYWWVGRLYQRPATALKARDNLTKAPLWGTIDETLEGVASVRAYELQSDLTKQFCQRLDLNNRARYSWDAANRWLSCDWSWLARRWWARRLWPRCWALQPRDRLTRVAAERPAWRSPLRSSRPARSPTPSDRSPLWSSS